MNKQFKKLPKDYQNEVNHLIKFLYDAHETNNSMHFMSNLDIFKNKIFWSLESWAKYPKEYNHINNQQRKQ